MNVRVARRIKAALVGYDQRQTDRVARRATIRPQVREYGQWYYWRVTKLLRESECKTKSTTA